MARGYREMLAEARAEVRSLPVEEAAALAGDGGSGDGPGVGTGRGAVFVDVRDPRELEREGMIPGARHATRGMLEFWIDSESPYHKPWFAEDRLFVFYCASGWRSLLAAQTAQAMGLRAASLDGGFAAWRDAGLPVGTRGPRP